MSYQICFCFWLLSFEQEIAENINKYAVGLPLFTVGLMNALTGNMISYHSSLMLPKPQ